MDAPTDARVRSGLAVAGLVAAGALTLVAVVGGLAMVLTFAGVCSPDDDCDSWKRRQLPFVVSVAVVVALGALLAGIATVAAGRQQRIQLVSAVTSLACGLTALVLESIYFTR